MDSMPSKLQRELNKIEPDLDVLAKLGADSIAELETLVANEDERLAAKAAHVLSLVRDSRAQNILVEAAKSKYTGVRFAVAAGAPNVTDADTVNTVLASLLDDQDINVRKHAIESAAACPTDLLRRKLEERLKIEPYPALQKLLSEALKTWFAAVKSRG
jgi:HEAT repeat protein